jgi:hypothetical protein
MNSPPAPPEGVSTSDVAYRPGPFKRLYDKITGKVAVKHPWYTLRRENLFDTSRLPSVDPVQPPPYDESYLTARTADGSWNDLRSSDQSAACGVIRH